MYQTSWEFPFTYPVIQAAGIPGWLILTPPTPFGLVRQLNLFPRGKENGGVQ
jgi:hypothetical protein